MTARTTRSPKLVAVFVAALTLAGIAHAQPSDEITALPDPRMTPGAINPAVTQSNIATTICACGWTRTMRPPSSAMAAAKRRQIALYGYEDADPGSYEFDHLVPLELGGAAADPRNLWPQAHVTEGGWDSHRKDRLENRLHALVCTGSVPLTEAQTAIATDWIAAFKHYVGGDAAASRRR
jgi:hypothetical protein